MFNKGFLNSDVDKGIEYSLSPNRTSTLRLKYHPRAGGVTAVELSMGGTLQCSVLEASFSL